MNFRPIKRKKSEVIVETKRKGKAKMQPMHEPLGCFQQPLFSCSAFTKLFLFVHSYVHKRMWFIYYKYTRTHIATRTLSEFETESVAVVGCCCSIYPVAVNSFNVIYIQASVSTAATHIHLSVLYYVQIQLCNNTYAMSIFG